MFCCLAELGVPLLAEAADEGLFEEFVGADSFGAPENFGAFAYLPTVEVHGGEAFIFLESDGVEMAGGGLEEGYLPFAVSLLQGAEAFAAGGVGGEDAVAPVDKRGDKVSLFVVISRSLLLHNFLRCRGEEWVDLRHQFAEAFVFLVGEGCAGIPLDAACAEAFVKVADEEAFYEVERYEGVFYLKH